MTCLPHGRHRSVARSERGETLIELLIAIALMGLGFSAILSGIFTSSATAVTNQQRAKVSLALQSWAEAVDQPAKDPSTPTGSPVYLYNACGDPNAYLPDPNLKLIPPGFTAQITKVRYLKDVAADGTLTWYNDQAGCYTGPRANATAFQSDEGLQELTLKVTTGTAGGPKAADTLVVLKRDQRCPSNFNNADLGPC
jgi:prepilin-type N-terminal cleavage/methylation domain-containing protein